MRIKPKTIVYSITTKIRLKTRVYSIRVKIRPKTIVYSITSSNQRLVECVRQDILYEKGKFGDTTNLVVEREIEG